MCKIFGFISAILFSISHVCIAKDITLTVIYNNVPYREDLSTDWGLSVLVEGLEKDILFDVGGNGAILLSNMKKLNINPSRIESIILSHDHHDHVGGLDAFLGKNNKVTIHLLSSFSDNLKKKVKAKKSRLVFLDEPGEVCGNVWSTGELGTSIKEQSMVISSSRGLIVITGCAHPGIVEIAGFVKEHFKKEIYLILGGFHLLPYNDNQTREIINQLKRLGVKKIAASHCTGDRQTELIREAWGKNFVESGCGAKIKISDEVSERK